jgi:hypothetical protein
MKNAVSFTELTLAIYASGRSVRFPSSELSYEIHGHLASKISGAIVDETYAHIATLGNFGDAFLAGSAPKGDVTFYLNCHNGRS